MAQARPEVVRRDNSARLALHRLHHHRGDIVADLAGDAQLLLHGVGVAKRHMVDIAEQRHRGLAELGLAHQAEAARGLAVEAAHRGDEAGLAGRRLGELHRALDGLGAAGDEEGILHVAGSDLGEQIGEHTARPVKQLLGRHRGALKLRLHSVDHLGMRPAEAQQPIAAEAVDIGASEGVGKCRAASAPLHRGEIAALGDGLAIVEEAGVVVCRQSCAGWCESTLPPGRARGSCCE